MRTILPILLLAMPLLSASSPVSYPDLEQLRQMAAQFAPTPLIVNTSHLSAGDLAALKKLIETGPLIDQVFLEQLWSGNLELYQKLKEDRTSLGEARFHLFWISKGPWADLNEHKAFLPDVPARKPPGANFYPANMKKVEFETWVSHLPPGKAQEATSFFTVIRRDPKGRLLAVPYYETYRRYLEPAAKLLREAAALTTNDSLRRFLQLRAAAFLSDDYYSSDVAWMDVDAPIDVTIGPYETYNDEIFGYKAGFEAYVCLKDEEETKKAANFSSHLQDVEDNLPLDAQYRNQKLGALMPIRVVNEVLSSGDGNHGVQTAAYNLPNDEKVVQQKGSKKVMLKNVQHAKFDSILTPISKIALPPDEQSSLNFEWFFTHILAHELSHGIGPHEIHVGGKTTSARLELKDLYSTIEEAKADITGLYMLQFFFDRGILPGGERAERGLYTTFLASAFRTLRFGILEAHGKGMALQFNYLTDHGAFRQTSDGHFEVDYSKIKQGVRDLTRQLLTIEAQGDYQQAKTMLDRLGVIRPNVRQLLNRMSGIPVDIEPKFITAEQLVPGKLQP